MGSGRKGLSHLGHLEGGTDDDEHEEGDGGSKLVDTLHISMVPNASIFKI